MLGYEFVIIHRVSVMTKDMGELSRHIDPLIYRYFVLVFSTRNKDICLRPFAYNV